MPVAQSRRSIARFDDAMTGFFGRVKRGSKAGFPRFKPWPEAQLRLCRMERNPLEG